MSPIIEIKTSKTYTRGGCFLESVPPNVGFKGVTISVEPGEIIALIGQSGSGKTTLSRIILGLEEPTSGEIWLNQKDGMD